MTFPVRCRARWLSPLAIFAATWLAPSLASAEPLTAEDAVARAAKDSPSLRASLLDAQAARHAIAAEQGDRDPVFVATVQGQYTENLGGGDPAVTRSDSEGVSGNAAVRYTTDVGTQLEVGVETGVDWRNAGTGVGTLGPLYGAGAYVSARQPLARGAGTDAVLGAIRQAQASATSADKSRELAASQLTLDVLRAYWELWYAKQSTTVQEQALVVANKQLADAKLRAETIGTGSRFDVLSFAQSAVSIRDALSQARANERSRAIELGRLLGISPERAMTLEAVGTPPALGGIPSADQLRAVFAERSAELASLRADIEAAETRVSSAKNADAPRIDAFGTLSMGLLWANDTLPGLSLPGNRPAFSIVGGLDFELPLGDGRTTGDLARARAQLEAAKARYQARVDAISAEVGTLLVDLSAADEQVEVSAESAKISADLAEAERQRFIIGTNASTDVVKAEQTAREAELRKLRALVDRATTRFQLEHAAGTLIDRFAAALRGRLT